MVHLEHCSRIGSPSVSFFSGLCRCAGLVGRGRKRGVHRKRRPRRSLPGMLLHINGSTLLLAQFGKESKPETVVPKISQEVLPEMIGTTRSRVSLFMNRFRKLRFIEYNGEIRVHNSLLNIVLQE